MQDNMDTMCGQTFNLTPIPNGMMRLKTTQNADYANNMNCTLILTTGLANHFTFTVESVHTESCGLDYLQIMDGNITATVIPGLTDGKICGSGPVGRVFRSFGNTVTLKFVSDSSAVLPGFSLHIEEIAGGGVYMESFCGKTIDLPSFHMSSLRLRLTQGAVYTPSLNCSILFTTRPSERFEFHFGNIDIENCTRCVCDWLEVRDGISRQSPYVSGIGGKICGNRSDLTSVYRTNGNSLYLLFVSDLGVGVGFNITIVSNHTGILESTQSTSTTTSKPYISTSAAPLHKIQEAISVSCNENSWTIGVNMDRLRKIYPDAKASDIYLGENRCKGIELAGVLLFHQSLEDCLSGRGLHNGVSTFTNELIYAEHDPVHPFIIRHYRWTIGVECDVQPNGTVSGSFSHHSTTPQSISASQYPVNVSFYLDPNFTIEISGTPLKAATGTDIYVKVFTTTADWNTVMKVQSCYTIPSPNATENMKFDLIKDGCEIDTNTHIISQSSHETRFLFEDFEYADSHNGLYMKCEAIFCTSLDWSTRCRQKCIPVVRRNVKREEMIL
ncbi:CUB and zona pellucida-like domain-containing protein 1 isoform X2 [Mercenaria mercenaria]|uniref:CUB and zona pellucida-like domain-containing protein 1 isoform X2 n=1 Tax=Mercenaria mercenaria TaxID=6596 RepID=UPI00234F4BD4|nr:CUB and zona pellucida-like domain-containing protein 1 isoform X2 [Mercenaria mercenaria]